MSARHVHAAAVLLGIALVAFLLAMVVGWILDPPWSFVSIPVASVLGWWCGRTVFSDVLAVGRKHEDPPPLDRDDGSSGPAA